MSSHFRTDLWARDLTVRAVVPTALLAFAGAAAAQNAPPAPAAKVQLSEGIETIIVTANKRAEDAQRVPIAISAITAEMAGKTGVVNAQTLAQSVPSLQMNRQTNGSTPFLRGVGNPSTQAGTEPAVAMYVDDVYYSSSAVALSNYNSIDRIEVLKGPQGTLFGRNATGGVVQVFTKNPQQETEADISVGYANYDTISGSFYATGGLTDTLSANFAAYGEKQRNGWGSNFTTGNEAYILNTYGGRAKLLWEPSDEARVLFNVDFDDYENGQAVYFRPAEGTTSSAPGTLSIPPDFLYDTRENLDPIAAVKQKGASIKANLDFLPVKFVSISAYRESEATQFFAQDGSSVARLNPLLIYSNDTFTQEFQFLSPDDSKITWVGGLYYYKDKTEVDPFRFFGALTGGGDNFRGAFAKQDTDSYSAYFQTTVPITPRANITAGVRYTEDKRELKGGRINRTAGVEAEVEANNSGIDDKWHKVTGRVSLDYLFTDDIMGYVAWNRGFKSGMFNTIIPPDFVRAVPADFAGTPGNPQPLLDPPVEPEEIDAYTVGMKSEFLNNRLRVNVEGFYYDYQNLQLQQVYSIPGGGTSTRLTNAEKATIKGVDIDITAIPFERMTVTAAVEFLDGEYDEFTDGQFMVYRPGAGGNCAMLLFNAGNCGALPPNYDPATGHWDLKGNETIQTPPFSASLTASYTVPVRSGELDFTVNYYYTGDYYFDADNGEGQIAPSDPDNNHQDTYDLINASITWYSSDDKWSVRLWGKNLNDQEYFSFGNETGTMTKKTPAPPRQYGITLTSRFK